MTYEEMQNVARAIAAAVAGEVLPFAPGDLPIVMTEVDGFDIALEISPA